MTIDEVNDRLRDVFEGLSEKGYKKTDIGKLLLGPNGYSAMSRFIRQDEKQMNIGIKPLSRIAEQAEYTIQLCITKKEDPIVGQISVKNNDFFQDMIPLIENYLNGEYTENMKKIRNSKTKQTLDELLSNIEV